MEERKQMKMVTEEMLRVGGKDAGVLKRFMQEFFPYKEFKRLGFFTKELMGNYYQQAKMVCDYFGYNTVFEYGHPEIRCHLSYEEEQRPLDEPFISVIPSIYE